VAIQIGIQLKGRVCEWQPFRVVAVGVLQCVLQCMLQCVVRQIGRHLEGRVCKWQPFRVETVREKKNKKNKNLCATSGPSLRMATLPRSKYVEVCSGGHICRQLKGQVCEWQPFRVVAVGVLQCVL